MKEKVILAPFTTFKIGGSGRYFFNIENLDNLKEAVKFIKTKKLPFFVLGGGSNLLISDKGFDGVILKINLKGIDFEKDQVGKNKIQIVSYAGENWDNFVKETVEKNLFGLENLSAIPGTVGASPVQNIGAYGVEVKNLIKWVEVFDFKTERILKIKNKDCDFKYRDSIFKNKKEYIVTRVCFSLNKKKDVNIKYQDLGNHFQEKETESPTLKEIRQVIIYIRSKKFPDLSAMGTAGSFFKNPIISQEAFKEFSSNYPEVKPYFCDDGRIKISAGWLIDAVGGWKGYTENNVGVYLKHALVFVNYGGGTCEDILKLSKKIVDDIFSKTKIKLEKEVVIF